nr:DUF4157 domain-containing protein [Hufsiella arboris]
MRGPFFQRNALQLWDPDSALGVWNYNQNFFRRLGLSDDLSGKAANFTTPLFIDSQLKASNPTWWEVTDRQLNTSSIVGTVPLFDFDAGFRNWRPLPFLQPKALDTTTRSADSFIQRKCAHCEEEEKEQKLNRKPLADSITPLIQTKSESPSSASDSVSQAIDSSRGRGDSIDHQTNTFMSDRFGSDFSNVNIHTDSSAVQLSRDLNAKAFTVGNDIYFNHGQYQPSTSEGKQLLAHELTHTLQQSGGTLQRKISGNNTNRTQSFLQRKCAHCEEEEKKHEHVQRKLQVGSAVGSGDIIRRKPPKDQSGDNVNIKYPEVIEINKGNWKEFGFNYINLFKHKELNPFDTPNAYANEVFKIQEAILNIIPEADRQKYPLTPNGALGMSTINWLTDFGGESETDADSKSLFIKYGIDKEILEKFAKIASKNVGDEPLLSRDFNNHELFHLININATFLLTKGDQNGAVQILQRVLMRLNYNIGEKGPDGVYGDDTVKALKAFQIESGMKKWEADGNFGYKTLRALDKRMSTASTDFFISVPNGDVRMFKVSIPRMMTREEKLVHSITEIFGISEKDALDLVNNKDSENKWNWLKDGFHETTEAELNRGYEYIGVPVKDYDSIITTIKKKPSYGDPVEPRLKELSIELSGFEKVYQLSKEIEELEDKKKGIIKQAVDPMGSAITNAGLDAQIKVKKAERAAELSRLNITEDIYTAKGEEFKRLFASYAVRVAMQMLDSNEKEASLEMIHYKKSSDPNALEQGIEIKNIFVHLDELWNRAEKEWWEGLSVAQGAAPGEITSEGSLNKYLKEKKGQRSHCFKGECTEPSDLVLPAYENVKFQKREGNSYFVKAYDSNMEAHKYLTESAKDHRVLAYPKLELRANISKFKELSPAAIEEKLYATAENVRENVQKTRKAIADDPMNVYKLKPVIELAKFQMGIFPDTIQEGLVAKALKDFEDREFWKNIGMAALGLGLGLLALLSGPVGWAALAGSIVVGSVDAYMQYQDIKFRRTAYNTAFDPAKALSDVEPGYFWFYVSVVFVGLDVFQGFKAIAAAAKAAKATEEGAQLATKLINAMNEDKKALQELIAQGGDNIAELTTKLQKLNAAITAVDATKLAKQINVLKHLNDVPQAVVRLSESLDHPEILKAFESMGAVLKKAGHADDVYKDILKFYAGPGNDFVAELPEFMRLAEKAEMSAKPELLKELLKNPKSQKVMLDFGENQDQFLKLWEEWSALKAAGKAPTFAEHLKAKGFVTELKPTKTIAAELGAEFAGKSMLTKNQQILRTIEPELANAFIEGNLPKKIQDTLTKILESDLIGETINLARAQQRMKASLRLLGASVESQAEYQLLIRMIKSTEGKMAFFEKATSIAGHEEYVALFTKYSKELSADSKIMDDFLKIGPFTDDDTFKWLLGNNKIRKLIADNPVLVRALKKCASPCFPIHADPEDIEKILKAIQDNGGSVDFSRLNQYMYVNRPRNATAAEMAKWKSSIDNLANDFKGTMKGVEMPKGADISLPPRFQLGGATPLKDAARKLDVLIKRGFAPKQLEDILVQANINKIDANEFMEQLSRASNKLGARPLDNISGILNGLSSTNPQKFETAYHFMRRIGDYSSGAGVDMVEKIFSVFDINEITKLRYGSSAKLSADVAKATGDVSVAGIELFGTLVNKINGSSEDIIRLATKAGGGSEADIVKLASIVDGMPKGSHSVAAVEARIVEAQQLAERIAAAGDNMGDAIWGASRTGDKWQVGKMFIDEASGKVSGSRAIAYIKGKSDDIISALLDSSGNLDSTKWKIFRKTIDKTDLPGPIRNHILGEMWDKTNVAAFKKVYGKDNVITQVTIRIKGTDTEAVIDAVIKDNGSILFREFKSGDAVLSPAQKKVYELMAQEKTELLEAIGDKAAQVWPDMSKFKVSLVKLVEESAIP